MFSSLSACTPGTTQTTSYTATSNHLLDTINDIIIKINNNLVTYRPIQVNDGDIVSATIISPPNFSDHQFYSYLINEVIQYFAAVNKSNYQPTLKPDNAGQRWYNYLPQEHTLSFKAPGQQATPLSLIKLRYQLTEQLHAIADPLTNTVNFYTKFGWPVCKATLPSSPIECREITAQNPVSLQLEQFYLVLANNGKIYRINLDRNTLESTVFEIEIYTDWLFEAHYETDIPFRGSYINAARAQQKNILQPEVTAIGFDGEKIWLAGRAKLWLVDLNFNVTAEYSIPGFINGLVIYGQYGFVTTKNNYVYKLSSTGDLEFVYKSDALGPPELHNGHIFVPESNNSRLVKINPINLSYSFVLLENVAPAYLKTDGTGLYITCHDNNQVTIINNAEIIQYITFADKVTIISVIDGYVLASHWLKDFQLLIDGRQKIIPVTFASRAGRLTHIGTPPVKIKTMSQSLLTVNSVENVTLLVNGINSNTVKNNDLLGVSFFAATPGTTRLPVVIGEDAFDYDITATAVTSTVRNVNFDIAKIENNTVVATIAVTNSYIPPLVASVEYGSLYVNDVEYTGTPITEDIVLTLKIPLSNDQKAIAPIFTLEDRDFAVPISYTNTATITSINELQLNQQVPEVNFNIQLAGTYNLPRYLPNTVTFEKNGTTVNGVTEFLVGDALTISNVFSSNRAFDEKSIFVVGPENYQVKTKTVGTDLINFLTFAPMVEPMADPEVLHTSNELTIQNANVLGANLVITNQDAIFIVNGTEATNKVAVFTGDQIAIARKVNNYYEEDLLVYQEQVNGIETDLIVRGTWPISNTVLLSDLYIEPHEHAIGNNYEVIESSLVSLADTVSADKRSANSYIRVAASAANKKNISTELTTSVLPMSEAPLSLAGHTVASTAKSDTLQIAQSTTVEQLLPQLHTVLTDASGARVDSFDYNTFLLKQTSSILEFFEPLAAPCAGEGSQVNKNFYVVQLQANEKISNNLDYLKNTAAQHKGATNVFVLVNKQKELIFDYLSSFNLPLSTNENNISFDKIQAGQQKQSSYVQQETEIIGQLQYTALLSKILAHHKRTQQITTNSNSLHKLDTALTILTPSLAALEDLRHSILLNISYAPIKEIKETVSAKNTATLEVEYIWTSAQLEKYGAFLTAEAATDGAIAGEHENFIILPIYRSNYYTYEILFDLVTPCIAPTVTLRPMAWLIRGG